jgi:hypothetical protein
MYRPLAQSARARLPPRAWAVGQTGLVGDGDDIFFLAHSEGEPVKPWPDPRAGSRFRGVWLNTATQAGPTKSPIPPKMDFDRPCSMLS